MDQPSAVSASDGRMGCGVNLFMLVGKKSVGTESGENASSE
jgi:hypothetical protein